MCRNIRTLFNFNPPATEIEIRDASLQFVRKLSGFNRPSQANQAAFDQAVQDVATAARELIGSLVTTAAPRDREREREKAMALAAVRYGTPRRQDLARGRVSAPRRGSDGGVAVELQFDAIARRILEEQLHDTAGRDVGTPIVDLQRTQPLLESLQIVARKRHVRDHGARCVTDRIDAVVHHQAQHRLPRQVQPVAGGPERRAPAFL